MNAEKSENIDRQTLLRKRIVERSLGSADPSAVYRREDRLRGPLSFAQRRMWLYQQTKPMSAAYNVPILTTLSGDIDTQRLVAALDSVSDSQEALRTTYHMDETGEPYQFVHDQLRLPREVMDLRELGDTAREILIRQIISATSSAPVNLAEYPGRFLVIRSDPVTTFILTVMHHIIWDGMSYASWSRDLSAVYRGSSISVPRVTVADFASYERRTWSGERLTSERDFWQGLLADPPPRRLPSAHVGLRPSERGRSMRRTLPATTVAALRSLSDDCRCTLFVAFVTCHYLMLRRHTDSNDHVIGTMVMDRSKIGADRLIGNFGDTVLLRLRDDGSHSPSTVRDLLENFSATTSQALSQRTYPVEELVETLGLATRGAAGSLIGSLVVFLADEVVGPDLPGVTARFESVFQGETEFPLTVHGFLFGDRLDIDVHYQSDILEEEVVKELVDSLDDIIRRVAQAPSTEVHRITYPTPAQLTDMKERSYGGAIQSVKPVGVIIAEQARRSPRCVAVIDGTTELTYDELVGKSAALAQRIMALTAHTIEPVVCIVLPRSACLIIAVIATYRAGGVVLFIDPGHPIERVRLIVEDARPTMFVTDEHHIPIVDAIRPEGSRHVIVERNTADMCSLTDDVIGDGAPTELANAAWIGYTSGSTGRPKAAVITHEGLAVRALWGAGRWRLSSGERRLLKSPLTFVDAISEINETLTGGGTLVIADDDTATDGIALATLVRDFGVQHLMAVPNLLDALVDAAPDAFASLRRLVSTGEALAPAVAARLKSVVDNGVVHNSYGFAEAAGDVIEGPVHITDESPVIPVGLPSGAVNIRVLNHNLRLVPCGTPGDLYIGGPQLARGYRRLPGLTATRFVADPYTRGGRLFRTGDRARWCPEGLQILGRDDQLIKVRGQRVELGELEWAARTAPGVIDAGVGYIDNDHDPQQRDGDDRRRTIVIAVVGAESDTVAKRLRELLPASLLPLPVLNVAQIPRLANGKVDRYAIGQAFAGSRGCRAVGRPPQPGTETILAEIFSAVLGIASGSVGAEDAFFDLGGDSVSAIRLVARAREYGLAIDIADVFAMPSPAELATLALSGAETTRRGITTGRPVNLSVHGHRLRRRRLDPGSDISIATVPLNSHSKISKFAVSKSLSRLARYHEAIRIRLDTRRGLWKASLTDPDQEATAASSHIAVRYTTNMWALADMIDAVNGPVVVASVGDDELALAGLSAVIDTCSLRMLAQELIADCQSSLMPTMTSWPATPPVGDPKLWMQLPPRTLPPSFPHGRRTPVATAVVAIHGAGIITDIPIIAAFVASVSSETRPVVIDYLARDSADTTTVGPLLFPVPITVDQGIDGIESAMSRLDETTSHRPISDYATTRFANAHGSRLLVDSLDSEISIGEGPVARADWAMDPIHCISATYCRVDNDLLLCIRGATAEDERIIANHISQWGSYVVDFMSKEPTLSTHGVDSPSDIK